MKTVLLIAGPSCSGKSALEAELCRRAPGTYVVAYDKLKWQLAGYDRDRDRETVKELLFGFFEVVCRRGLPVILQTIMRSEDEYRRYADVAREHGYRMAAVRLSAPEDVLVARFRDRVLDAARNGSNISVTDEGTYRKNLATPFFVPDDAPAFDTSVASVSAIADELERLLSKP
jgi:predicted kinase